MERAYLFIAPTNITLDETRTETTVHLRVDNPGRTPGILTMVYGQFSKKPPKGETPDYEGGGSKEFELVVNSSNGLSPHDPASNVILPVTFKIDPAKIEAGRETADAAHEAARALGEPPVLPAEEMTRVAERIKTYGQPRGR